MSDAREGRQDAGSDRRRRDADSRRPAGLGLGRGVHGHRGRHRDALNLTLNADERPELVLLDIGLPDLSGLDCWGEDQGGVRVRDSRHRGPGDRQGWSAQRWRGRLHHQAVQPREVVARVRSVLRRSRSEDAAEAHDPVLRFDGLTIDPDRREVTASGRPVTLTALDFDLLLALADAPGRVFSRAQLLEKVWGYDFYGDERVVDVHVRTMRSALGDDAQSPRIIGTVRGVGYKFLLLALGRRPG